MIQASTATLRTMVAMLEIRLDAMHDTWRQSSGSVDLRQARAGEGSATVMARRGACGIIAVEQGRQ